MAKPAFLAHALAWACRVARTGKIHPSLSPWEAQMAHILGFRPKSFELYKASLIHRSTPQTARVFGLIHNERLEFLGDAILSAVVADYLFRNFPEYSEGELSKSRARLVSRSYLNHLAAALQLDALVMLHPSVTTPSPDLSGNALEALIGAVFLDRGYKKASQFVLDRIIGKAPWLKGSDSFSEAEAEIWISSPGQSPKNRFNEWAQGHRAHHGFHTLPDEENPGMFVSRLFVDQEMVATGLGRSKKEAEQDAAQQALVWAANRPTNPT
jgi:ribonuclease-3